jgi:hypothetical protein
MALGNQSTSSPLSPPIPTYEDATSSRPQPSQSFLGSREISHDAERQGLLGRAPQQQSSGSRYEPPTVESARSSLDFLPSSGESSARNSAESLRREMAEMEVLDPQGENRQSQRSRLSKHITSLTNGLSSINLPFRRWLPFFQWIRAQTPSITFRMDWMVAIRLFGLIFLLSLTYLFFFTNLINFRRRPATRMFDPESVKVFVQGSVNETLIMENLEHATLFDHIAGTEGNYALARWVENAFNAARLENVELEEFTVYLNYPKKDGRRVAIVSPPELAWEAKLEEELAYQNREQTMVFHGHSASGDVKGPLIYANYGSREDFQKLKDDGINLNGSIVLVRYYGTQGNI